MKKLIAGCLTVICLFLCACGSYRPNDGKTPESVPPMTTMMPDVEDGIVNDTDGVLEENEETARHTTAPNTTVRP